MLSGSLVEMCVGLHSCLCFSLLEKLQFYVGRHLPRHLLDTWSSVELLMLFLIAISTPPQHLMDRSRFLLSSRQILDTCWIDRDSLVLFVSSLSTPVSIPCGSIELRVPEILLASRYLSIPSAVKDFFLDTFLDSFLDTSRHLSCRDLLRCLFKDLSRFFLFSLDFSRSLRGCSSPFHSPFTQILQPSWILLIPCFNHLVRSLFSSFFMHFMF